MTAHTKTRTDVGWDALDEAATLHRAALARTARQLAATDSTQAHTWAAALRWLVTATDDPPPNPGHYTDRVDRLATVAAWRKHWETQMERPQITGRRDRYVQMDQDLRAADWAVRQLEQTVTIGAA